MLAIAIISTTQHTRPSVLQIAVVGLIVISCAFIQLRGADKVDSDCKTYEEDLKEAHRLRLLVRSLRKAPQKRDELAIALAQLSMLDQSLCRNPRAADAAELIAAADGEAREAVRSLPQADHQSRAFLLSRMAICRALNLKGQHGARVLKPLLDGNWSDLERADIYNELSSMVYSNSGYDAQDYARKALELRVKAVGPHSLEVAESLISLSSFVGESRAPRSALMEQLQLDFGQQATGDSRADANNIRTVYLSRAARIQEDILGSDSLALAETLSRSGEKEQLRAIEIYKKRLGSDCPEVQRNYMFLACQQPDRSKAQAYVEKARLASAHRVNSKKPPESGDLEVRCGARAWSLDTKKLAIPELDWLMASGSAGLDSDLAFDQLYLDGAKGNHSVFRMRLPSLGGDGIVFTVTGPGRFLMRQQGAPEQGCEELEYQWNGKSFQLVAGKPCVQDAKVVQSAIDDAVSGVGYYGIRGHHTANHDLIRNALLQADFAAQELFKKGDAHNAAERLRTMFELTSDLIMEASTGRSIDCAGETTGDDVTKWTRSWACNSPICPINLTVADWSPLLKHYQYYRSQDRTQPARLLQ